MNKKIPVILTGISLILSASVMAQQGIPAVKKYKWHHPWFNKDIVSDSPPSWPYKIIEEKNGVILVEVTPPGTQKESAPPAPAPAPAPPDIVEVVAQGMGIDANSALLIVYPIDIQTYFMQGPLGDRHTESWGA